MNGFGGSRVQPSESESCNFPDMEPGVGPGEDEQAFLGEAEMPRVQLATLGQPKILIESLPFRLELIREDRVLQTRRDVGPLVGVHSTAATIRAIFCEVKGEPVVVHAGELHEAKHEAVKVGRNCSRWSRPRRLRSELDLQQIAALLD
jgi:hypothetical protein